VSFNLRVASKEVERQEASEAPFGYRKVEPENFHGCGSIQLDGDLRGTRSQFRAEPPSGYYRESSRSGGSTGGTVAVYAVRFDGSGDVVPTLHALSCTH
jgi:hypothetical protein